MRPISATTPFAAPRWRTRSAPADAADEVLVDFGFLEWRDNLGFSGGRTVWLNPVARAEFLAQRDPRRTYIYLRTPVDAGDSVHIEVERGGPEARTSRRLVLHPTADGWLVTADEALP
jgi:hypothetical protein